MKRAKRSSPGRITQKEGHEETRLRRPVKTETSSLGAVANKAIQTLSLNADYDNCEIGPVGQPDSHNASRNNLSESQDISSEQTKQQLQSKVPENVGHQSTEGDETKVENEGSHRARTDEEFEKDLFKMLRRTSEKLVKVWEKMDQSE